ALHPGMAKHRAGALPLPIWRVPCPMPSSEQDAWAAAPIVDAYLADRLALADPALDAALAASAAAGLPEIAVSPAYGRLLYIFVRSAAARRILEIGTLGGYSAIWLARALPAAPE